MAPPGSHQSTRRNLRSQNPRRTLTPPQLPPQPILPFIPPNVTQHQNIWALLKEGVLCPIGNKLVRWLQQCPNHFWIQVEEALERALRSQVPLLPANTHFGRVIVNLTAELAMVSSVMALTEGIPPLWRAPRAVIRGLLPNGSQMNGMETMSKLGDVEVLENLMAIISMESSLPHLPFLAREDMITVIEVHQQVLSFRLSMDRIQNGMSQPTSYRVVLNPQTRETLEIYRDYCRRESAWRRRRSGRGHTITVHNILSMKILLWNCRGAGNPSFRRNFAELMRSHQPIIVVLVKTKISG
jgi:hypothetical protein